MLCTLYKTHHQDLDSLPILLKMACLTIAQRPATAHWGSKFLQIRPTTAPAQQMIPKTLISNILQFSTLKSLVSMISLCSTLIKDFCVISLYLGIVHSLGVGKEAIIF